MDGREPVSQQSIRVALPYEAVVKHVLGLDPLWLQDAALSALPPEVAPFPGGGSSLEVRIGEAVQDGGMAALPLIWNVTGRSPWRVSGMLTMQPAADGLETAVALRARVGEANQPDRPWGLPAEEVTDFVARTFLQRLYWALEALRRTDDGRVPSTGGVLAEPAPEDYDW